MKRLFINERVREIANNRTPVKIFDTAKIILHILPESSINSDHKYDIEIVTRNPARLEPIKSIGVESSHTYDGFVTYTSDLTGLARTYVHLYKNGRIEAVECSLLKPIVDRKEIPSIDFEKEIIEVIPKYVQVLQLLNIKPPFFMFLSLAGVKDYTMKLNKEILGATPTPIEEDEIKTEEIYVKEYWWFDDAPRLFKPAFDEIWNACGLFKSFNFDEDGNWGNGLNMK
ncbi:MAG: hypothetical protein H7641_05195 [Candidatus Heimdallarchaeota archaeon]|nr:hypothetical protein [Candidatus Heimdallarchaeota archaeon]MCK4876957.1 hypothetical protein [Candidatus Heimdallarchaeota archaeon]